MVPIITGRTVGQLIVRTIIVDLTKEVYGVIRPVHHAKKVVKKTAKVTTHPLHHTKKLVRSVKPVHRVKKVIGCSKSDTQIGNVA